MWLQFGSPMPYVSGAYPSFGTDQLCGFATSMQESHQFIAVSLGFLESAYSTRAFWMWGFGHVLGNAMPLALGCPNNTPTQLRHLVGLNSSTIELKAAVKRRLENKAPLKRHVLCNCHFFIAGNRKTSKLENDFLLSSGWIFDG